MIQKRIARRAALGMLVLVTLATTACAPIWVPIEESTQRPFTFPTIEVELALPIGWMSSYYAPAAGYAFFTVHGGELEEIWVRRFLKTAIVKGTNRTNAGDLTVQDMATISIDSRRLDDGIGSFEVVSNRPATIGDRSCFRLDYRHRNEIGLEKRTIEYGCPIGVWLYRFEFMAPSQHYFDRYLPDFEAVAKSIRFTNPGA